MVAKMFESTTPGIDGFAQLIPDELMDVPGHVFYTGETGFTGQRPLYLLGLNPGGDGAETVRQQLHDVKAGPPDYSAYVTHTWKPAARIDHNVRHLLRKMALNPAAVPASSLVFARSAGFADIKDEFKRLADLCWPFHEVVIRELGVKVVVCFGKDSTNYVRRRFGADEAIDHFVEQNRRGWTSTTYSGRGGLKVVGVTHPSRADWRNPAADVSDLIARALAQS